MSLLTQLTESSLDEGYAEAAARRSAGHDAPARPGRLLAVGALAAGLLLGTAGVQTHERRSAVAEARNALIEEITQRTEEADALADDVATLRSSVSQARQDRLRASVSGTRLARELSALETWTGAAAAAGPGLVVHLEDNPEQSQEQVSGDPRGVADITEGKVTDRDLQTIVNEIWLAGAEAVAVNGQRLTSLSAIRSAGPNILVSFRPLNPPYDVVAVGDPVSMRSKLVNGFGGSYLDVLRNYGIRFSIQTVDRVRVPASAGLTLRYAGVPGSGGDR